MPNFDFCSVFEEFGRFGFEFDINEYIKKVAFPLSFDANLNKNMSS